MEIMDLTEAIVKIANHERVIKHLEPNLMWHENVKEWQVKRILYAWRLLEDELRKDTGGTVPQVEVSIERAGGWNT